MQEKATISKEFGPVSKKGEGEFWNTYGKLRNVADKRGYDGRYSYVVASKIVRSR